MVKIERKNVKERIKELEDKGFVWVDNYLVDKDSGVVIAWLTDIEEELELIEYI